MPKSILVLSDQTQEQQSIVDFLKNLDAEANITAVADTETAFAALELSQFDCVFCQLSAGPDESVNFVSEVWNRKPQVDRFVLAPTIDAETQIRCVFGAHIYLPVPLQNEAVRAVLELTGTKNTILRTERLQVLISRMRSLPSKPKIYFEVLKELRSADANVTAVAALIEKDAGIATKLIQVVNSLFYGRAEAVHDIKEAILFLGFEVTASVVLSLEAITRFEDVQSLHELSARIWSHSQTVAELGRRITQTYGQDTVNCDSAYLAGLLHDLGKLVLAQNFPEEFQKVGQRAVSEKRPVCEAEKELMGVSHADAGAYLLAAWGLPLKIVEAVASHESTPDSFESFTPAVALHLAEAISESGKTLAQILQEYPEALQLAEQLDNLNALVPRSNGRGGNRIEAKVGKTNAWMN